MGYSGKHLASPPSDNALGVEWPAEQRALQECGEIAALRLSSALSDSLQQAAEQLFTLGTQAPSPLEREILLDTADFARLRRQALVDDFRKHFEQRYVQACRRRKAALISGHVIDFDVSHLRIVEHDLLEDAIDPEMVTEAIRNGSWGALYELTKWFRKALEYPELNPNDIPVGPKLIAEAASAAIKAHFCRNEVKHRLMRALSRQLPGRINQIYRDLVHHLIPQVSESSLMDRDDSDPYAMPEDGTPAAPPVGSALDALDMTGTGLESRVSAAPDAACDAVSHCMSGSALPKVISDFLTGQWQAYLVNIHTKHGASSHAWKDAIQTMDDLVRSLRSKPSAEDCARLVKELPGLVKRLSKGLEALGEPLEMRDRFFISLAKCHVKVLTAARTFGAPAHAASRSSRGESQAKTAAVTQPLHSPDNSPPDSQLQALEAGAWLEFLEPNGGTRELRLGKISPHRNVYLFTNHQGERVLALRSANLSTLLGNGRARIIPSPDAKDSTESIEPVSRYRKTA